MGCIHPIGARDPDGSRPPLLLQQIQAVLDGCAVFDTATGEWAGNLREHRQEVRALRTALEQAHGENLTLRRELTRGWPWASADHADDADLVIPLGDAPVPARPGQPCPPRIGPIGLSVAKTAQLTSLAVQAAAGLITRARLAFALRWSARRRRHQAIARWHHHSARLTAVAGTGNPRTGQDGHHAM